MSLLKNLSEPRKTKITNSKITKFKTGNDSSRDKPKTCQLATIILKSEKSNDKKDKKPDSEILAENALIVGTKKTAEATVTKEKRERCNFLIRIFLFCSCR